MKTQLFIYSQQQSMWFYSELITFHLLCCLNTLYPMSAHCECPSGRFLLSSPELYSPIHTFTSPPLLYWIQYSIYPLNSLFSATYPIHFPLPPLTDSRFLSLQFPSLQRLGKPRKFSNGTVYEIKISELSNLKGLSARKRPRTRNVCWNINKRACQQRMRE